jgi:hypothetical protein
MADFVIKQGDLGPDLDATLKDGTGAAVVLTGATVKFTMRKRGATTLKINEAAATIIDAAGGKIRYPWVAADTDTPGIYDGEFEVTFSGGEIQTWPNERHLEIQVVEQLG